MKKGFRVVPGLPEYMVDRRAAVRHIETGRPCWLERVGKNNEAMIVVQKDGNRFIQSAQALRDLAFPEEKTDD